MNSSLFSVIIVSNMQNEQPININISRANEPENNYNEFKEYLVINNLDLQAQTVKLREEINELKNQLNEKENDEDKHDASTRYMRSLLINLNELKKGYKEISENRKYLVNEVDKLCNDIHKKTFKYNIKTFAYFILLLIINKISTIITIFNNYYCETVLYATLNTIVIYMVSLTYFKYYKEFTLFIKNKETKQKELNDMNKNKEEELKKLEDSTLSLENWIYEI